MAKIYFSTGSNQGNRLDSLVNAAKLIGSLVGNVLQHSAIVESEPWGFDAETTFYNQVLQVETELSPLQVLNQILEIEKILGRIRFGEAYSSRTIDIDILFYDEQLITEDNLLIPHPLLHERKFVLVPLATIAPDFIHPVLKTTITALLSRLDDSSPVEIVVDEEEFARLLNQKN